MANRDHVEQALMIADGILMTLFHLRSSKSISDRKYAMIHDAVWKQFTDSTGWTRGEINNELSQRACPE